MTVKEPATTVSIASGPLVGPILRRVVGMLAAAELPGVGNIVERVASDITVEPDQDGREHLVILVPLNLSAAGRA